MEKKIQTCSFPEKSETAGGLLIMNTLTCREKEKKVILASLLRVHNTVKCKEQWPWITLYITSFCISTFLSDLCLVHLVLRAPRTIPCLFIKCFVLYRSTGFQHPF